MGSEVVRVGIGNIPQRDIGIAGGDVDVAAEMDVRGNSGSAGNIHSVVTVDTAAQGDPVGNSVHVDVNAFNLRGLADRTDGKRPGTGQVNVRHVSVFGIDRSSAKVEVTA